MANKQGKDTALGGLRVLDLADEKGLYCGKLLADMGADVIKIERPGGDATRNIGPFYHDQPNPDRSLYFWQYNTNKRGVTLDLASADGKEIFKKLVKTADIVIETYEPGYLDGLGLGYEVLRDINSAIVLTSITPFGQNGPYAHWKALDIVSVAMGGMMNVCGDPDRDPVMPNGGQAYHTASHYAAIGSLLAFYARWSTGRGQHVDISMQEAVASCIEHVNDWYHYAGVTAKRQGGLHWSFGFCVLPCKDGWVLAAISPNWDGLVDWMEGDGFGYDLRDPKWIEPIFRILNAPRFFKELCAPWAATHTVKELFEGGQQRRVAFAPINTPEMIHKDPHINERGFFVPVVHPELNETFVYPGAPYKFGETPWRIEHRAPLVGEHNEEILVKELGLSQDELIQLAEGGVTQPPAASPVARVSVQSATARWKKPDRKPLDGIKVVDFTWVLAGPFCSRLLAYFGAEVIKVEPRVDGDKVRGALPNMFRNNNFGINLSGYFNNNNPNKYGLTLNVNTPRGQDIVKKMVARADIVVENFSARVMKKWGLDYASLTKVKPDIIMVSMSGMGHTGPYRDHVSFGPTLQAISGITYLMGYPDRGPVGFSYSYSDHVGGLNGALASLTALEYRRRTGKGQHVDLAQLEATCALLETAVLDYTVNGHGQSMTGNRLPNRPVAPHGAYRCQGEDRWLTIAVTNDGEWQAFCRVIGNPEWTCSEKFNTILARNANFAELDRMVESWTKDQVAEEAMRKLQEAGVAAGVIQNAEDLYLHDPQMKAREFFYRLQHAEIGECTIEGVPIKLSENPGAFERPSPLLSEHNDYVLRDLLSLTEDEVNELIIEEII